MIHSGHPWLGPSLGISRLSYYQGGADHFVHVCINFLDVTLLSPGSFCASWRVWVRGATPNATSVSSLQIWADPGKYALMGAAAQLGESCLPRGQPSQEGRVRHGARRPVFNLVSLTTPYRV